MKLDRKWLVLGLVISLFFIALISMLFVNQIKSSSREQSSMFVHGLYAHAQAHFNALIIDYEMLRNSVPLFEYIRHRGNESELALYTFLQKYIASNDEIQQVRVLDPSGQEIFRMNNDAGTVSRPQPSQLQDKSDRYYYHEAKALQGNDIYISALDLNVENGVIETPYRPVIRLASKIYDANKQYFGILVLNFSSQSFIDNLAEYDRHAQGKLMLIDEEGNYLYHPNDKLAWSFMFDGKGENFASKHHSDWQQIVSRSSGQHESEQGELLSYIKLELPLSVHSANLPIQTNQRHWYIVNQLY